MIDISTFTEPVDRAGVFTAASVSLIWVARTIWRRLAKDNTEVAKDRAEINIIDTLQSQIATLSSENLRLRDNESSLSIRLGRLESKEKETEDLMREIERLQTRLDQKEKKLEEMMIKHVEETTRLSTLLGIKDGEIKALSEQIKSIQHQFDTRGKQ